MSSLRYSFLALACLLTISACDSSDESQERAGGTAASSDEANFDLATSQASAMAKQGANVRSVRDIDEMFVALNGRMRGFGGFHFEDNGSTIVITMKPRPGNGNNRPDKIKRDMMREMRRFTGGEHLMPAIEVATPRMAEGSYDFVELQAWRQQLLEAGLAPFVTILDNNESINRITLGVDPGTPVSSALALLDRVGVPHEAVSVEEIPEPTLAAAPSSIISSYASNSTTASTGRIGGIQIQTSFGTCTSGFTVVNGATGERGFLTASHCTQTSGIGGVSSTRFWQPTYSSSGLGYIGTERVDPVPYTNSRTDGNCPSGYNCRYSDAAYVRFENQSSSASTLGAIARTTGYSNGSAILTVNQLNPEFLVTSEYPFPVGGQIISKVGVRSGWTSATVGGDGTCRQGRARGVFITCSYTATNRTFESDVAVDEGDSGAPVFILGATLPNGRTSVSAAGIVYAVDPGRTGFYFSALGGVQLDLGDYQTCSTCG